jgi:hypothetical protein
MGKNPVHSAFRAEARSLLEKARAESGVAHPGLRGGAMESLLRGFLKKHLPRRFDVVCGCAIGANGAISAETDVIVYDSLNCPTPPATTNLIPAESVTCAVEVKTTLRASHIPKACRDASRLKSLERNTNDTYSLAPDGKVAAHSRTIPVTTQVSLIGFFSGTAIPALARKWHRHYCDVPFGHQIDCIASIESGFISVGCWHPGLGYKRTEVCSVYALSPGHEQPYGTSVLLFLDVCARDWTEHKRVRVGPRVPWAVGSALFVCADACEDVSLFAWFTYLTEHIRFHIPSDHIPSLGHFADCLRPNSTLMLPLAIAVDPKRLVREKGQYVAKAVAQLLYSDFTEDSIRTLENG